MTNKQTTKQKTTKQKTTKTKITTKKNKTQLSTATPLKLVTNDHLPIDQTFKQKTKIYKNPVSLWEFRINANENEANHQTIIKTLKQIAKYWVFQKEKGETTGYLHYQGKLSLIKKKRKSELLSLLKTLTPTLMPNYLEPSSTNSYKEWFYVMKEETRIEGPWKDTDPEIYIPQQYKLGHELYPYQQQILDSIRLQHTKPDRFVNILVDPEGSKGKSYITGILTSNRDAIIVPPLKSAADIVQYVCSICIKGNIRHIPCIFFDLPRAMPKADLTQVFSGIEQIKNGILYDTRYTGKQWEIESPTIWVFTNSKPDSSLLSKDRWIVWAINTNNCLYKT